MNPILTKIIALLISISVFLTAQPISAAELRYSTPSYTELKETEINKQSLAPLSCFDSETPATAENPDAATGAEGPRGKISVIDQDSLLQIALQTALITAAGIQGEQEDNDKIFNVRERWTIVCAELLNDMSALPGDIPLSSLLPSKIKLEKFESIGNNYYFSLNISNQKVGLVIEHQSSYTLDLFLKHPCVFKNDRYESFIKIREQALRKPQTPITVIAQSLGISLISLVTATESLQPGSAAASPSPDLAQPDQQHKRVVLPKSHKTIIIAFAITIIVFGAIAIYLLFGLDPVSTGQIISHGVETSTAITSSFKSSFKSSHYILSLIGLCLGGLAMTWISGPEMAEDLPTDEIEIIKGKLDYTDNPELKPVLREANTFLSCYGNMNGFNGKINLTQALSRFSEEEHPVPKNPALIALAINHHITALQFDDLSDQKHVYAAISNLTFYKFIKRVRPQCLTAEAVNNYAKLPYLKFLRSNKLNEIDAQARAAFKFQGKKPTALARAKQYLIINYARYHLAQGYYDLRYRNKELDEIKKHSQTALAGREERFSGDFPEPKWIGADALYKDCDQDIFTMAMQIRKAAKKQESIVAKLEEINTTDSTSLAKAVAGTPTSPFIYSSQAQAALQEENYELCTEYAQKAIAEEEDYYLAHYILGKMQLAQGNKEDAYRSYERAVVYLLNNLDFYEEDILSGLIDKICSDLEEAEFATDEEQEQALMKQRSRYLQLIIDGDHPVYKIAFTKLHQGIKDYCTNQERNRECYTIFKNTLDWISPHKVDQKTHYSRALMTMGDCYGFCEEPIKAIACYEESLPLIDDPRLLAAIYNDMALMYSNLDEYDKAVLYSNNALTCYRQLRSGTLLLNAVARAAIGINTNNIYGILELIQEAHLIRKSDGADPNKAYQHFAHSVLSFLSQLDLTHDEARAEGLAVMRAISNIPEIDLVHYLEEAIVAEEADGEASETTEDSPGIDQEKVVAVAQALYEEETNHTYKERLRRLLIACGQDPAPLSTPTSLSDERKAFLELEYLEEDELAELEEKHPTNIASTEPREYYLNLLTVYLKRDNGYLTAIEIRDTINQAIAENWPRNRLAQDLTRQHEMRIGELKDGAAGNNKTRMGTTYCNTQLATGDTAYRHGKQKITGFLDTHPKISTKSKQLYKPVPEAAKAFDLASRSFTIGLLGSMQNDNFGYEAAAATGQITDPQLCSRLSLYYELIPLTEYLSIPSSSFMARQLYKKATGGLVKTSITADLKILREGGITTEQIALTLISNEKYQDAVSFLGKEIAAAERRNQEPVTAGESGQPTINISEARVWLARAYIGLWREAATSDLATAEEYKRKAITHVRKAIADDSNPRLLFEATFVCRALQLFDETEDLFNRIVAQTPSILQEGGETRNSLGYVLNSWFLFHKNRGTLERSLTLYKTINEQIETDAIVVPPQLIVTNYTHLAATYSKLGLALKAQETVAKALNLLSADTETIADFYLTLGDAYHNLGNPDLALTAYFVALDTALRKGYRTDAKRTLDGIQLSIDSGISQLKNCHLVTLLRIGRLELTSLAFYPETVNVKFLEILHGVCQLVARIDDPEATEFLEEALTTKLPLGTKISRHRLKAIRDTHGPVHDLFDDIEAELERRKTGVVEPSAAPDEEMPELEDDHDQEAAPEAEEPQPEPVPEPGSNEGLDNAEDAGQEEALEEESPSADEDSIAATENTPSPAAIPAPEAIEPAIAQPKAPPTGRRRQRAIRRTLGRISQLTIYSPEAGRSLLTLVTEHYDRESDATDSEIRDELDIHYFTGIYSRRLEKAEERIAVIVTNAHEYNWSSEVVAGVLGYLPAAFIDDNSVIAIVNEHRDRNSETADTVLVGLHEKELATILDKVDDILSEHRAAVAAVIDRERSRILRGVDLRNRTRNYTQAQSAVTTGKLEILAASRGRALREEQEAAAELEAEEELRRQQERETEREQLIAELNKRHSALDTSEIGEVLQDGDTLDSPDLARRINVRIKLKESCASNPYYLEYSELLKYIENSKGKPHPNAVPQLIKDAEVAHFVRIYPRLGTKRVGDIMRHRWPQTVLTQVLNYMPTAFIMDREIAVMVNRKTGGKAKGQHKDQGIDVNTILNKAEQNKYAARYPGIQARITSILRDARKILTAKLVTAGPRDIASTRYNGYTLLVYLEVENYLNAHMRPALLKRGEAIALRDTLVQRDVSGALNQQHIQEEIHNNESSIWSAWAKVHTSQSVSAVESTLEYARSRKLTIAGLELCLRVGNHTRDPEIPSYLNNDEAESVRDQALAMDPLPNREKLLELLRAKEQESLVVWCGQTGITGIAGTELESAHQDAISHNLSLAELHDNLEALRGQKMIPAAVARYFSEETAYFMDREQEEESLLQNPTAYGSYAEIKQRLDEREGELVVAHRDLSTTRDILTSAKSDRQPQRGLEICLEIEDYLTDPETPTFLTPEQAGVMRDEILADSEYLPDQNELADIIDIYEQVALRSWAATQGLSYINTNDINETLRKGWQENWDLAAVQTELQSINEQAALRTWVAAQGLSYIDINDINETLRKGRQEDWELTAMHTELQSINEGRFWETIDDLFAKYKIIDKDLPKELQQARLVKYNTNRERKKAIADIETNHFRKKQDYREQMIASLTNYIVSIVTNKDNEMIRALTESAIALVGTSIKGLSPRENVTRIIKIVTATLDPESDEDLLVQTALAILGQPIKPTPAFETIMELTQQAQQAL